MKAGLTLIFLLGLAGPAIASVAVHTHRGEFSSRVSGLQVETLDGLPTEYLNDGLNAGDIVPMGTFGLSATGFSEREDGVGVDAENNGDGDSLYMNVGGSFDYGSFTIHFPEPATAFGAEFDFLQPATASISVMVQSEEFALASLTSAGESFIGFTSAQPFDRITLVPHPDVATRAFFSLDDLMIGQIPEPHSPLLLLLTAWAARVRRHARAGDTQTRTNAR